MSSAPPLAGLQPLIAKTLRYTEKQEALLRRLGSAVVLHWDALSDDMQDLLIDQAEVVEDRQPEIAHGRADLELFVRTVKAVSLSKAAPQSRAAQDQKQAQGDATQSSAIDDAPPNNTRPTSS